MKGLIFNINRFAIHDGPGIRVTFFLKGCPLSCSWCHNPEGIFPGKENVIRTDRIGDKSFRFRETVGYEISADEVISILDSERIFIDKSGGGVTFSGGEPFMQPEFLSEVLHRCRLSGYNTAVDTSGHFPAGMLEPILEYTDLLLFDIKHLDPERHYEYTGKTNELIMENYRNAVRSRTDVMIRIPVIPGFNDDDRHLEMLRQFILDNKTARVKGINLLPYHRTGMDKYKKLNKDYILNGVTSPSQERMNYLEEFFSGTGLKVKIGG